MLCCLAALIGTAAEVTVTFSELGFTNGQTVTDVKANDDINLTFAKASSSTAPAYYSTGTAVRLYNNGTLKIAGTNSAVSITKIAFTCAKGNTFNSNVSSSVGTMAGGGTTTPSWSGNANDVLIKCSTSDKHARIQAITITYDVAEGAKKNAELSFAEESYNATLGNAFEAPTLENPNNLAVTYASSEESVATVDATTGLVTIVGTGVTTISATSEENDDFYAGEASYTLTVSKAASAGDNVVKIDLTKQGYENTESVSGVKLDDVISATFDKGTGANEPKFYSSSSNPAVRFYNGNILTIKSNQENAIITKVVFTTHSKGNFQSACTVSSPADGKFTINGTEAILEGNGTEFSIKIAGGTTYVQTIEVFYSVEDGTTKPAEIAYDVDAVSVLMGEEFTSPVLANPNSLEVTFTSSNEEVATVDTEGKVTIVGPGTTEITATSAATEEFRAGKASYILNVTEAITCAGFFELTAGAEVIFKNPLTVLYQTGANLFVTDGTANLLVYGALNAEFANGDVIAKGAKGTVAEYSGNLQLTPVAASFVAAGKVEAIAPTRMTIAEALEAPIYSFVELYAVDIEAGSKARNYTASTKESEMAVYDNFYNLSNEGFTADENCIYNVIGFMGAYKGTAQLNAYEITEVSSAPTINGMAQNPGEVKDPVKVGDILTIETPDTKATISYLIEEADAPAAIAPRAADATAEWVDTNENPYSFEVTDATLGKRITFAANKNGVRTGLSTITLGNNGTITGIEGVEAEAANGEVEYFNLQGVRVANPTEGLYIRRQGNKVEKVAIR